MADAPGDWRDLLGNWLAAPGFVDFRKETSQEGRAAVQFSTNEMVVGTLVRGFGSFDFALLLADLDPLSVLPIVARIDGKESACHWQRGCG